MTLQSVLHVCVSANGHVGILRLLLSHDQSRDAVYIRDARGSSPLHDAAEQGQVRCLRLLVESTGGGKRQLLHQANEVCVGVSAWWRVGDCFLEYGGCCNRDNRHLKY